MSALLLPKPTDQKDTYANDPFENPSKKPSLGPKGPSKRSEGHSWRIEADIGSDPKAQKLGEGGLKSAAKNARKGFFLVFSPGATC